MNKVFSKLKEKQQAAQARLGPFWWHSAVMFVASRMSDVLHIVVGLFLVPLYVPEEQLGAVLPLLQLGAFFGVPLKAAAKTTARYVTGFRVSEEIGRIRTILRDLVVLSLLVSGAGAVLILAGQSFFAARLRFDGHMVPVLVGGIIVVSCWRPVLNLANQGLGHYYRITGAVLVAGIVRIILALMLIPLFALEGYLAMQLFGGLIVCMFLLHGFGAYFKPEVQAVSNRELLREVWGYFLPMLLLTGIMAFQALMEPWIIRHRLPEVESAAYYVASRFGMIPAYIGGALVHFLFPMVSEKHDRAESTSSLQYQVYGTVFCVGIIVTTLFFFSGEWLLNIFSGWRGYVEYSGLLWQTSLIAVGKSIILLYTLHEAACRRFGFLWVLVPVILLEIGGLYSLMGWTFFRGILPSELWQAVDALIVRDISFIIGFMIIARAIVITGILVRTLVPARSESAVSTIGNRK